MIDHQTPEGHTALTYAAFRGTTAVNLDGRRVLAVSMLLDRAAKRPNINRETRLMGGHTALTLASRTGRLDVIEALLERGAELEYETLEGKTALIHAASTGKWDTVRYLVEMGANVSHRDHQDKSAIEWARDSNFLGVMRNTLRLLPLLELELALALELV